MPEESESFSGAKLQIQIMKLTKRIATSYNRLKELANSDNELHLTMKEIEAVICVTNGRNYLFVLKELGLIDYTPPARGLQLPTKIIFFDKNIEDYVGKTIPYKRHAISKTNGNGKTPRLIKLFECLKGLKDFSEGAIMRACEENGCLMARGSLGYMLDRIENYGAIRVSVGGKFLREIEILRDEL